MFIMRRIFGTSKPSDLESTREPIRVVEKHENPLNVYKRSYDRISDALATAQNNIKELIKEAKEVLDIDDTDKDAYEENLARLTAYLDSNPLYTKCTTDKLALTSELSSLNVQYGVATHSVVNHESVKLQQTTFDLVKKTREATQQLKQRVAEDEIADLLDDCLDDAADTTSHEIHMNQFLSATRQTVDAEKHDVFSSDISNSLAKPKKLPAAAQQVQAPPQAYTYTSKKINLPAPPIHEPEVTAAEPDSRRPKPPPKSEMVPIPTQSKKPLQPKRRLQASDFV